MRITISSKVPSIDDKTTIIDAKGLILGRMASIVAKRLLNGEKIIIVNAKDAVISGKRLSVIQKMHDFLQIGHPKKGPLHPRRPETIVKRAIRGMLPYKTPRGKKAFKRLRVYMSVPEELKSKPTETIPEADVNRLKGRYITIGEIARLIQG
ncbi:50S ribosomal protein L13 [Candidatus Bathyarchaeota archaeon]|nr:50S ribosomal protein L13 [Candidatus Bathyarchaeota archaeon]